QQARRLLEIARTADPDPDREQVRTALANKDAKALEACAEKMADGRQPARTVQVVAMALRQLDRKEAALRLLKAARKSFPRDFWIHSLLGFYLFEVAPHDWIEAEHCFGVALLVRPDSSSVLAARGNAHILQLQTGAALDDLTRAHELAKAKD